MSIEIKNMIKAAVLIFAVWLAQFLEHETLTALIFTTVFSCGGYFAFCNRKNISAFAKKWPSSLAYTAIVFYICKIVAEKTINATTGIEVENIRYASTIGGVILSVPISLLLISICMLVCWQMKALFGVRIGASAEEHVPGLKIFFIGTLMGAGMLASSQVDPLIRYAVLADASKVTTCGPVENDVVYIRKNPDTCSRIHVNLFKGIYDFSDVPAKSN
jgi:hypothetical protein